MASRAAERRRRLAAGEADLARTVALLGDPARGAMLVLLLDGHPHSISELAVAAGVALSTASEHVAALRAADFVAVDIRGRTRAVRLVRRDVVDALEALARIAPGPRPQTLTGNAHREALRDARLCYDHVAGRLGVDVFDALVDVRALESPPRIVGTRKTHGGLGDVTLGPAARAVFSRLDIDVRAAQQTTRRFAISCLDWSHERPHLAGALGAEVARRFLAKRWIERTSLPRVLRVTPAGRAALRDLLGLRV